MGAHKTNVRAIVESARPAAPARQFGVAMHGGYKPKRNVLIADPTDVREVDGRQELLLQHPGAEPAWEPTPEGAVVVRKGEPLHEEHLDYVIEVQSVMANHMLTDAQGRPRTTGFPVGELARIDAREFVAMHERAAGGRQEGDE